MDHKIISEFESWNALATMFNLERLQSFLTTAAAPFPELRTVTVL